MHRPFREVAEEFLGPGHCLGRAGTDDLGQIEQFGHGLALGDALRTERHLYVHAGVGQSLLHQRRDTGIHR